MKKTAILATIGVAAVLVCISYAIGQIRGYSRGVEANPPTIVERVDTVTVTEVRIDTVYQVRTKVVELPKVDTVTRTVTDTVAVMVPISRYIAHKDSLYHVEATGYEVEFEQIQVYPKTVTIEVPVYKTVTRPRWSIGLQAGYGVTVQENTVRLTPYVGVGVTYNVLTW